MKKIFLTILLILLSFIIIGSGNGDSVETNNIVQDVQEKEVYRHFGTANFPVNHNTSTTIDAYITRCIVTPTSQKGLVTYKYLYEVILTSGSSVNGVPTNTNLYGVRIFYNGKETSAKTFPMGFNVLILREPTMIYWMEMDDQFPEITFNWKDAMYQTLR